MPIETDPSEPDLPEYIIVSDQTSEIVFSSSAEPAPSRDPLAATIKLAGLIRKGGGAVTIFKATKY